MDSANQIIQALTERFRSLSPPARRAAVALIAVLFCSAAFLLYNSGPGKPETFLMNEPVPAGQLPAIEAALAKAGLDDYVIEDNRIKVPAATKTRYIGALADANALPPDFGDILDDAISSGSPFDSREQKAERIKNARQRTLAQIIGSMHGIDKAMVMYDEAASGGIGRKRVLTASVSVKPAGSTALALKQVRAVRNLVAGAIAGMAPDSVSVTDLNTGRNYAGADALPLADIYAEQKHALEQQWQQKIVHSLNMVPGIDANVDLTLQPATDGSTRAGEPQWWPVAARVVLSVPRSYIESVWRQRYRIPNNSTAPLPPAGELQDLEQELATDLKDHVARLTSTQADSELEVALTVFDDVRQGLDAPSRRLAVLGTGRATPLVLPIAVCALAIAGFLIVRQLKRPVAFPPDEDAPAEVAHAPAPQDGNGATTVDRPDPVVPTELESTEVVAGLQRAIEPTTPKPAAFNHSTPISNRLVPGPYVSGIELNDLTGRQISQVKDDPRGVSRAQPPSSRPFQFLHEASAGDLAQFLAGENAQVIAVVFSHLEPRLAAEVLEQLPVSLQTDVVRRLTNLDEMNDEVIREIESGLELWLAEQLKRTQRRNAGQAAVKQILSAASRRTRKTILDGLADENPSTPAAEQSTPAPQPRPTDSAFDDVLQLNDEDLRKVLRAADPHDVVLALAGTEGEFIDRVIRKMRPREANRLRLALQRINPTQLAQVEKSQHRIAQLAQRLRDKGRAGTSADGMLTATA